jgi:hypothetical protein
MKLKKFQSCQATEQHGLVKKHTIKEHCNVDYVGLHSIDSIMTPYGMDGLGMESW